VRTLGHHAGLPIQLLLLGMGQHPVRHKEGPMAISKIANRVSRGPAGAPEVEEFLVLDVGAIL